MVEGSSLFQGWKRVNNGENPIMQGLDRINGDSVVREHLIYDFVRRTFSDRKGCAYFSVCPDCS